MSWRKFIFVFICTGMAEANAAYDLSDVIKAYIGLAVKHDDNLYRRSDDAPTAPGNPLPSKADTIIEPRAGLKLDKSISLQTFGLDLNVYSPIYTNSDYINFNGWKNSIYWNWAVGRNVSGVLRYQDNRALSAFDDVIAIPDNCGEIGEPNQSGNYVVDLYRDKKLNLDASWVIAHNFVLGAGLSRVDNSHSQRDCLDQRQDGFIASLAYVSDAGNKASVYLGRTEVDYQRDVVLGSPPVVIVPASTRGYEQNDAGMSFKWLYSPRSEVNLRWGRTEWTLDAGGAAQSANVGSVRLTWRYSPKTALQGGFERMVESGTDRSGRNVVDSYDLRMDWAATEKTSTYFSGRYLHRTYDESSTQLNPALVGRRDRDASLELGINYHPRAALTLTSYVNYLHRNTNVENTDYQATVIGFTSQWWF